MKLTIKLSPDRSTLVYLVQIANEKTYALQLISSWAEQLNYRNGWRKLLADRIRQGRSCIRRSIEEDKK
jgi:hypothetical protein